MFRIYRGERMTVRSNLGTFLLCAASALAVIPAAQAQEQAPAPETVVVTGSRVISSITNSPTPLTTVSAAELQAATPTDIPDALNKLPVFQNSVTTQNNDNAETDSAGNVLNLRSFGPQRTLVLLDGHRVAPSNSNGTVDVDTLPEMLVSRVDVVTGGASAVYGSDAVTGVVNYILNAHFSGVKAEVNGGISGYGDGASYTVGVAAGTDLFGNRGHLEGDFRIHHEDGVKSTARPLGDQVWNLTGGGTASNPYTITENTRLSDFSFGGKVSCGCSGNNQQFVSNGVLGPFNAGTATGTTGIASGGDGVFATPSQLVAMLSTQEGFLRFSYNVSDSAVFYVEGSVAQSVDAGGFLNDYIQKGHAANRFYANNPYLSPTAQALLANSSGGIFNMYKYIDNQGPNGTFLTDGFAGNMTGTAGLDGQWGDYNWDFYYTHSYSREVVRNPNNENNERLYASEDAVLDPSGQVVCEVSLTQYASRYPNCVPSDLFGPDALSSNAFHYFAQNTQWIEQNTLDDVGASISGNIFDGIGAGPVKAALSAEYRNGSYSVLSNAVPTDAIDCTGLRLCQTTSSLWQNDILNTRSPVSEGVWEVAMEVNVPLLKDLPFVQSLTTDLAGRFTDYGVSGPVQTWKIGLNYHVNDDVAFRATNSVDIRAPTLNDLFSPLQTLATGFDDLLTNTNGTALGIRQGNDKLVPEVARTYTAGIVLTPTFVPNLTASVDYYSIGLKNAIGSIGAGSTAVQNICISSGGSSPFCQLYIRPFPMSNTTPANYPTEVITESLNTAVNRLEGWDIESDYNFDLSDITPSLPGSVSLRALANYQPVNESISYIGAPLTWVSESKVHGTVLLAYTVGNWSINVQDRWLSPYTYPTQFGQVYAQPHVQSKNYDDVTIDRKIKLDDSTLDGYLTVQNIFDVNPPIAPTNIANPGIYFLGAGSRNYPEIGRYFTLGVRASL